MIISADTRIPFRVPRLRHLPRQAHRTRTLLAECATDRYQVAPREGGLIHFVNEWHGGGEIIIARRNQWGDALVDRFRHLERVRVHDCVAYRDTRIHRGGPLRRKEPLSRGWQRHANWKPRAHDQHEADQGCRSCQVRGHTVEDFAKKVDRTCYRWARGSCLSGAEQEKVRRNDTQYQLAALSDEQKPIMDVGAIPVNMDFKL